MVDFIKSVRTRQPQGVASIDWTNQISISLVGAYLPTGFNAVTGATAGILTAGKTPTRNGVGLLFAGGTEVAKYDAYQPGNPFTAITLLVPNFSSSSNTRQGIWHYQASAGAAQNRLRMIWLDATNGFYVDANGGFAYRCKPTFASGDALCLAYTRGGQGTQNQFYINGAPATTANVIDVSAGGCPTSPVPLWLGDDVEFASGKRLNGSIALHLHFARVLSPSEIKSLNDNPWQIFKPISRSLWIPGPVSAGGDPIGDIAATESGTDTASLSGQIVVQGALSATESGTDTAAIQGGASPITGTISATESGADTSAISGGVVVAGALAATESGTDTASIAAQLVVQGSLAATESGADTALINGSSVIITTGTLAAIESGADGCVATGSVLVQGLLDAAESGTDTVYAPGQIYVIGSLAATETGSDTCAIAGNLPVTITGTLNAVEFGADTCQIIQSVITAVYPQPNQVLSGITYGPTGADYTGTATGGSGPTAADIAAAVWSYTQ